MGREYPDNWKLIGILGSFLVSFGLRALPILFGPGSEWIYYLPFWLAFELYLLMDFAIYGWIGITCSIALDAFTRPGLLIFPPLFILSEIVFLTLTMILVIRYRTYDPQVTYPLDYEDVFVVYCLPIIVVAILDTILVFSNNLVMIEASWWQLCGAWLGRFLPMFPFGLVLIPFLDDHIGSYITPLKSTYTPRVAYPKRTPKRKSRPKLPNPSSSYSSSYGSSSYSPSTYGTSTTRSASAPRPKARSYPKSTPSSYSSGGTHTTRPSTANPPVFPQRTALIKPKQSSIQMLSVSKIPSVNDHVRSNIFGDVKLTHVLKSGGEGTVFLTDTQWVCKIYKKSKLTVQKKNKIDLILQRNIDIPGVCLPKDIVTYKGVFVGYLMEKAEGKTMKTCMFTKDHLRTNFPYWNRKHLVTLAITILEKIVKIHNQGILIGDINPLNILIKDERNVFFVDTDSYQIGQYPCPVGFPDFVAPEIQGVDCKTFLRTPEHEAFAVAVLIFMILLPGKHPYSQLGGGRPSENIKKMDFSYPLGSKSNRRTPPRWNYIWSHFPRYLKREFYECFRNNRRNTSETWLSLMQRYSNDLQAGYISDELFPTERKKVELVPVQCSFCKQMKQTHKAYLKHLEKKGESFRCEDCK